MNKTIVKAICLAGSVTGMAQAQAFEWQSNEVQYQYGKQDQAYSDGNEENVHIATLQHASGWKYGDNFAFVDFSDADDSGKDTYGEVYLNFSLGKISGNDFSLGPVKDVGLIAGYNYGHDAKIRKYLPGVRFAMNAPGFSFLNVDVTAYIDDNEGVSEGGAPKEDDSYMVDVNWALPWQWGHHAFTLEGHVEYIDSRDNEFGERVESHILAQPQLRYDLGNTLWNKPGKLFVGIEYQYWQNKQGDKNTDEHMAQFLAVYRF